MGNPRESYLPYRRASMSARTDLFSTMFTQGFGFVAKAKKHVFTVVPVGMLHLPSGRLVIGTAYDFYPLTRLAPTGVFSVEASLATVSDLESRIAGLRIVFSTEAVVTWEVADGEFGGARGFAAPSGLYIDAQLLPSLQVYIEGASSPDEWYYDPPKKEGKTWQVACFAPDDDRLETCTMFGTNSYNNDGPYISYWGLDASGAPAVLVTDVNLVP